jgi:hypothetical protein
MFSRAVWVKAPTRTIQGFGRGPNEMASADRGNGSDELIVQSILTAASQQRPRTMGEFGQFVRPYLSAGYQREVAEAHRRYFGSPFEH